MAQSSFDLNAYLAERKEKVEVALDTSLPIAPPETVYNSMRYSLLAGGNGCVLFSVWQPVN